ncbi:hypothetical protein JCM3766R1_005582 [Sporobolomyces carnicolor]
MRAFTVTSLLALSALAAAQGADEGVSSAVVTETGAVDPGAGPAGTVTTPTDATSTPVESGGGLATPVESGAGNADGAATGAVPEAVQSFTSANSDAIASILSQQAVDPSAAASGASALLASGFANPEISSFIASNPTWSALAAQVTGSSGGTAVDSSLGSGAASPSQSATETLAGVTSQVTTTKATVPVTHGAPKSADTASASPSAAGDSGNGAGSVRVGATIALVLGSVALAVAC